jgi:hypothetical protein
MIFQTQALLPKSFLQRLFRQEPVQNAIIEVNNLLASNGVGGPQVAAIEQRYQLKLAEEFALNLQEFYAVRWNDWLKNGHSKSTIEEELNELATLFHLTNTDQLIQLVGESWYGAKMNAILAKKQVSNKEEAELAIIQAHVRLHPDTAKKLFDDARQHILETAAAPFIKRERLSPTDEQTINDLAFDLHISATPIFKKLAPSKHYWQLENLPLQPIINTGQLQKNEQCYFEAKQVKWLETRSAGRGYSQLEQVNYGTLYLTNKRLVFEGNIKNSALPYDRIRNISQHKEGIQLYKDKGKDPVLQLSGDHVAFPIILKRLINSINHE